MAKKLKSKRVIKVEKTVGAGQKELLALVNHLEHCTREYVDFLEEVANKKIEGMQEKRAKIARSGAILRSFIKRHSLPGVDDVIRTLRYEVK